MGRRITIEQVTIGTRLAAWRWYSQPRRRSRPRRSLHVLPTLHERPGGIRASVCAAWVSAFNITIVENPFYRAVMGLDYPARNAVLMLLMFITFRASWRSRR